jgi:hypothetical protein
LADTITTVQTTAISLNSTNNPLTIAAGGGVSVVSTAPAIYGGYAQAWQVYNGGALTGAFGIALGGGGFVSNASTGVIIADGDMGSTGIALKSIGSVVNAGTISSTHYGVVLRAGGEISNLTDGTIWSAGSIAAYIGGSGGTVSNAGLILGDYGVKMTTGTVINETGGTVSSANGIAGIYISAGGGTITNAGLIENSASAGIVLAHGGLVSNQVGGMIAGGLAPAVEIEGSGTVINAGTIVGLSDIAVLFTGTGNDRVVIDPGAAFQGIVAGSSSASNMIELAAGTATGIIPNLGNYIGFTQVTLDDGARWEIGGNVASAGTISFSGTSGTLLFAAPGAFSGKINGFHRGDTIGIAGFVATGKSFTDGLLTLTNAGGQDILALNGDFTTADFTITATPGRVAITTDVACFCAGTHITTATGEVAVEHLKIGDYVRTLHGGSQKIKWIGRRSYAGPFVTRNHRIMPVHIRQDAIAPGIPARDLFVSPGHALCIDGVLIHAWRLINGVSITQVESLSTLTYFHIELDNHEIIFAENCLAETFMGESFRNQFQNAQEFSDLYQDSIEQTMCLPRLDSGFALQAIHGRIAARAGIATAISNGPLQGYLDQFTPQYIAGWARTMDSDEPICLDIRSGGHRIGRVLANIFRQDVRDAGFGSGVSGFEFTLPLGFAGPITIHRATDGATLQTIAAAEAA